MMPGSLKSAQGEEILPGDRTLLERAQLWSSFFEKIADKEVTVDFLAKEILYSEDEAIEIKDSFETIDTTHSAEEFEDSNTSNDSKFDVKEYLDCTLQCVEKRKENWERIGIDKSLKTFKLNDNYDKVQDWLRTNDKYYRNKYDTYFQSFNIVNRRVYDEEVQIKEYFSENESLQSVDTAKYILTNRKLRSSQFTKMTIKHFCYSQRQQQNLHKRHHIQDSSPKYKPLCDSIIENRRTVSEPTTTPHHHRFKFKPVLKTFLENENLPLTFPRRERKKKLKLRHRKNDKNYRSASTSSITSTDSFNDDSYSNKNRNSLRDNRNLNVTPKLSSFLNDKSNIKNSKMKYRKSINKKSIDRTPTKKDKIKTTNKNAGNTTMQSEIGFHPESFINSTEIKNKIINEEVPKSNIIIISDSEGELVNNLQKKKSLEGVVNKIKNEHSIKKNNNKFKNVKVSVKRIRCFSKSTADSNSIVSRGTEIKDTHAKLKKIKVNQNKNKKTTINDKNLRFQNEEQKDNKNEQSNIETFELSDSDTSFPVIRKSTKKIDSSENSKSSEITKSDDLSKSSVKLRKSISLQSSFINKLEHIIIHDPAEETLANANNSIDKVIITEDILKKFVGKNITQKFLSGEKNFSREYNSSSKIVFLLPDESASESDEFSFCDSNSKGKLVEIFPFKK